MRDADSTLTYSVTRRYPFRWFTPAVILGGLAFLVLLSFINYASSGYTLVVRFSSNPNVTSEEAWFGKGWPSLLTDSKRAQCQATVIPLQTKLLTNNTALTYTLMNVQSEADQQLPSLIYLNNQLQSCTVTSITLYLDLNDRTAAQIAFSHWGIDTQARVTCFAALEASGWTTVNLTADWNPVPASVSTFGGTYQFLGTNSSSAAALFWGESLLQNYYTQVMNNMTFAFSNFTRVEVTFNPRGTIDDIRALDYYNVSARFIEYDLSNQEQVFVVDNDQNVTSLSNSDWVPNIWIGADSLAKSFQSTVYTDLGQLSAKWNILLDPTLLQYYTQNFSSIRANTQGNNATLGQALEDFDTLKGTTGPLVIQNSTLATSYLCNVPQRKPLAELTLSILVADLVFMQALWKLFTLCMGQFMQKRDPKTNWCEGCLKRREGDDIGLLDNISLSQRRWQKTHQAMKYRNIGS